MAGIVAELVGVERHYRLGDADVRALAGVDLAFEDGEYAAIMGPSGSGKSTLLNVLGCLDRPTSGVYRLGDKDVSTLDDDELSEVRNTRLGFVFQNYSLIPQLDVLENIEVPLFYAGASEREARVRATELAERMGLGDRIHHRPSQLSGGQQQRVAIARSLANDPILLLADEPTGNLDSKTGEEILALLDELHAAGKTLLIVTHDPNVAARADRIVRMRDGRVERIEVAAKPRPERPVTFGRLVRLFRLAAKSLRLHKLRSLLTALGIMFGVGSVVAMLAIGEGASRDAQQQYLRLGSRNLIVRSVKPPESSSASTQRTWVVAYGLLRSDVEAVRETIPHVGRMVARRDIPADLWNGSRRLTGRVFGTEPAYKDVTNLTVTSGRFLSDEDSRAHRNVCVLGARGGGDALRGARPLRGLRARGLRLLRGRRRRRAARDGARLGGRRLGRRGPGDLRAARDGARALQPDHPGAHRAAGGATSASSCTRSSSRRRTSRTCPRRPRRCARCSRSATRRRTCS